VDLERQLEDANEEADYWKRVAMYLADCHAATAYHFSFGSRSSKSELRRQASIMQSCVLFLNKQSDPGSKARHVEDIIECCSKARAECEKRTVVSASAPQSEGKP